MALFAAGRVITEGYDGPRTCRGCSREVQEGEILVDIELNPYEPMNPDLCVSCIEAARKEANRVMHDYLDSELAQIRLLIEAVRVPDARH